MSPFYKILAEKSGKDLTEKISRFYYERSVDEDDIIDLAVDNCTLEDVDSEDLAVGSRLVFTYGYIGGEVSVKRTALIQKSVPTFGANITMKLTALDEGFLMKRESDNRVWNKKRSSEIAKEIADFFGIKSVIDQSDKIHEFMPMGNKTYYAFMKYLAQLEGSGKGNLGSFRFMIKNNVLYFTMRDLSKESIKTFRYRDPNGEVQRFSPKLVNKSGESISTKGSGIDPDTGEILNVKLDNENTQETGLGKKIIGYDVDGKEIFRSVTGAGKIETSPEEKQQDMEKSLSGNKKDSTLKEYEADLTVIGSPIYEIDEIVTVENVGSKHSGNWYISKIIETIERSGYYAVLGLKRNGSNVGDGTASKNQNKSTGPDEAKNDKEVKVYRYDENGNVQ